MYFPQYLLCVLVISKSNLEGGGWEGERKKKQKGNKQKEDRRRKGKGGEGREEKGRGEEEKDPAFISLRSGRPQVGILILLLPQGRM